MAGAGHHREHLISELLGDNVVQQALDTAIAAQVSALLGGGDLGQVVGAQVATALVGLIADPTVITALTGLVDTVAQDFFRHRRHPALSDAASDIALALITGEDLATALAAAGSPCAPTPTSMPRSVARRRRGHQLLSDTSLWRALDTTVSTLISELLGDNVVQQALDTAIAAQVSALLGGGDLGQVVGAQVATALVGLIADPTVITAPVTGLVDTVAQDFFGATGVIPLPSPTPPATSPWP